MAGKKEKKAKKDGKKSSLLPKVIGGIKLPKDARRQLTGLAKHPVIADLLSAGLVALAHRIKGDSAKPEPAPESTPVPPAPAAEPKAEAATAKPVVKRVRKPAASAGDPAPEATAAEPAKAATPRRTRKPATPAASTPDAAATKVAKAPPPRRTRKAKDTPAKPRTRRTTPKTES
jgi:hypothetical protein